MALFGGAFLVGGAAVPESVVAAWTQQAAAPRSRSQSPDDVQDREEGPVRGISLNAGELMLGAVTAPTTVGTEGVLAFRVKTVRGDAVTAFDTEHDKGAASDHGAKRRDAVSAPAPDDERGRRVADPVAVGCGAGTYRVHTGLVPSSAGAATTLTRTVDVGGGLLPQPAVATSHQDEVDGFTVTLDGDLTAGSSAILSVAARR